MSSKINTTPKSYNKEDLRRDMIKQRAQEEKYHDNSIPFQAVPSHIWYSKSRKFRRIIRLSLYLICLGISVYIHMRNRAESGDQIINLVHYMVGFEKIVALSFLVLCLFGIYTLNQEVDLETVPEKRRNLTSILCKLYLILAFIIGFPWALLVNKFYLVFVISLPVGFIYIIKSIKRANQIKIGGKRHTFGHTPGGAYSSFYEVLKPRNRNISLYKFFEYNVSYLVILLSDIPFTFVVGITKNIDLIYPSYFFQVWADF